MYQTPKRIDEMDRLERSIHNVANKESIKQSDLTSVTVVAQIETILDIYREQAQQSSKKELRNEAHKSSRLGAHLNCYGDPKPHPLCHAHAIVSGAHKQAGALRAILAHYKLGIDDAYNGCWLPENTAALKQMPGRLKKAVPHSRIHRFNYYFWLNSIINLNKISAQDDLKYSLKTIGQQLQAGAQADYVMDKKGSGLPK